MELRWFLKLVPIGRRRLVRYIETSKSSGPSLVLLITQSRKAKAPHDPPECSSLSRSTKLKSSKWSFPASLPPVSRSITL